MAGAPQKNYLPEAVAIAPHTGPNRSDMLNRRIENPSTTLVPQVVSVWATSWNLAPDEPVIVPVVPNCCVSLVFEQNMAYSDLITAKIVGPMKSAFMWRITGAGSTFGATFAPGGFYPYFGKSVRELMGNTLSFIDYFGDLGQKTTNLIMDSNDFVFRKNTLEKFLLERFSDGLPNKAQDAMKMFSFIRNASACMNICDLQAEFSCSERTIQRLFDEVIGLSPKVVIRTLRFQDALKGVLASNIESWADFAASLGYSDQAHFIREFREITGCTPGRLAAGLQF